MARTTRLVGRTLMIAGPLAVAAGVAAWAVAGKKLADEKITVADDAKWFAGQQVKGPLTAFAEADVIEQHSRKMGSGKTYAELPQDDPIRPVLMNASFLRASLFTSVLSFGVSAMVVGLGVLTTVLGHSVLSAAKRPFPWN